MTTRTWVLAPTWERRPRPLTEISPWAMCVLPGPPVQAMVAELKSLPAVPAVQ